MRANHPAFQMTQGRAAVLLACCLMSVAGCGSVRDVNNDVASVSAKVTQETAQMQTQKQPTVIVSDDSWLLGDTVAVQENELPILKQHVMWHPTRKVSLADAASYLTATYGIPIDISDLTGSRGLAGDEEGADTNDKAAATRGAVGAMTTPTAGTGGQISSAPTALSSLPMPPGFLSATTSASGMRNLPLMKIDYEGDLKGLINVIAQKEGIWEREEEGRVIYFDHQTETIYLPAISTRHTVKSNMVSSGAPTTGSSIGQSMTSSTSDTNSAGNTTVESDYDIDFWDGIKKTAQTIGGGTGKGAAQIAVSPALSAITVTGTPTQVRNVARWAHQYAHDASKMVTVTVRELTYTLTKEDNNSWSPAVIFNKLGSANKWTWAGASAPAIAAASITPFSLGFSVLSSSSSSLAGSEAALNMLSTMGKLVSDKSWSTAVLNGQLGKVQMATQVTYAAQAGGISTANVGTTSLIQPGVVTTGLTGTVRPVLVDGAVTIALDVTDSVLQGLIKYPSGGASIQEPQLGITQLPSSVAVKPGEMLLATGVVNTTGSVTQNGVFVPNNPLLGGGTDGNTSKTMLIVEITAEVK